MAIESNVALLTHDHSGISGGTARLFQSNTHQSPDTDSSTSSLHHTLGSGATQSAAGNHSHTSYTELLTAVFGGVNRTVAPVVEVYYFGGNVAANSDVFAGGGWGLSGSAPIDTDSMFAVVGGYSTITVPIAGRYLIHYHTAGNSANALKAVARVSLAQDVATSLCVGTVGTPVAGELHIDAIGNRVLNAGQRLYWSNWSTGGYTLTSNTFGENSYINVRYIGPR